MDLSLWKGSEQRRTLVVLGAGASRGASFVRDAFHYEARPPLDCDFFSELQRLGRTSSTKEDVGELLRFVRVEFGFDPTLSMEQFFSQVESTNRFHEDIKINRGRKNAQYQKALKHFYCSLPILFNQAIGKKSCEYHERLVASLHPKDVVLSFNYDCLIDTALRNRAGKLWKPEEGYGFDVQGDTSSWRTEGAKERDAKKSILLLKPHGSLNWNIDEKGKVNLEPNPYDIKTAKGRIVPPTWFKDPKEEPYKSVWQRIRREIQGCRALVVIGYSMPSTDLFSRALFKTDLRSIEFLVVANPDISDRRRFIDLIKDKVEISTPIVELNNLKELVSGLKPLTDGEVRWGSVPSFFGLTHSTPDSYDEVAFQFYHDIRINFDFPHASGGYFYFTLPAGAEPETLVNEMGHEQIHKWKQSGSCEWRLPYEQNLLERPPQYYTLVVRPAN